MKSLLTLCFLLMMTTNSWATQLAFKGVATDLDTGELIYTELHNLELTGEGKPLQETVVYLNQLGVPFGRKNLQYTSATTPDYETTFDQFDWTEAVVVTERAISISGKKETTLDWPDSNVAIDSGFHYFVQSRLDSLINGEAHTFSFLSASRARFIDLNISAESVNNDQVVLNMVLDNFFLARLISPIELTYDVNTKQLLRYSGLTNVPGADGKLLKAQIDYYYP